MRVDTLRSALSAFSYKKIEAGRELEGRRPSRRRSQARQAAVRFDRRVSRKATGPELAAKELAEREILAALLPAQKGAEDIRPFVRSTLSAMDPAGRNQGSAMKAVIAVAQGRGRRRDRPARSCSKNSKRSKPEPQLRLVRPSMQAHEGLGCVLALFVLARGSPVRPASRSVPPPATRGRRRDRRADPGGRSTTGWRISCSARVAEAKRHPCARARPRRQTRRGGLVGAAFDIRDAMFFPRRCRPLAYVSQRAYSAGCVDHAVGGEDRPWRPARASAPPETDSERPRSTCPALRAEFASTASAQTTAIPILAAAMVDKKRGRARLQASRCDSLVSPRVRRCARI